MTLDPASLCVGCVFGLVLAGIIALLLVSMHKAINALSTVDPQELTEVELTGKALL